MLFYQAVNFNMDAVGMPVAAATANGPNGVQQHNSDLDSYADETSGTTTPTYAETKFEPSRSFGHVREDISSSTDSSGNGLSVVPEERRSRWGLRKTRKDSTKEKR